MWKNYVTTAFRNLNKQRFYSLINILGLSVGIAGCLLISLFVIDELSFDRYHKDADRIYRMRVDLKFGENEFDGIVAPAPLAETMIKDFPEVETAGRFRQRGGRIIRPVGSDQDNIREEDVIFADREIFDIFTIPLISGNTERLSEPNTVAISESAKNRQFGESVNAVGKALLVGEEESNEVVAVYKDFPSNNHFHFDFIFSLAGLEEAKQKIWLSHNFVTYFKLKPGTDIAQLEAKFPQMVETYVQPQLQQFVGKSLEEMEAGGDRLAYFTQPLTSIHLEPDLLGEMEPGGDIAYVYIFSAIALFLLLIACVNFMNLATARSANRAREVGVRKALGSQRHQLIWQFLTESMLITAVSVGIALVIAQTALPYFNQLSGKELALPWQAFWFIPMIVGLILVVGLLAGMYPSLFLSKFRPSEVLKGKLATGSQNGSIRSILVVFQFTTSIVLIVSTVIVYQQLNFVQARNLGYNKEQVLMIENLWDLGEKAQSFKKEVANLPEVEHASLSSFIPVSGSSRNNNAFWPEGNRTQESTVIMQNWQVDHDYITTMKMKVLQGRDFDPSFPTDSQGVILNETAVRRLGFGPDPLGKRLSTYIDLPVEGQPDANVETYTVMGVVQDFHFESLKDQIAPLGLFIGDTRSNLLLRLRTEEIGGVLGKIETMWKEEFAPNQPFQYAFLDERFDAMYRNESRVGKIFGSFAGLAIFIACLGLFALATFMAEQRTKEIGVRKVLGASASQILILLSQDFLKLVGISILIAVPVAWFLMGDWLSNYEYNVGINVWAFVLGGVSAVVIALLTVSSQSWQAARTNPADSLRDE